MKPGICPALVLLVFSLPATALPSASRGSCEVGFENIASLTSRGWVLKNNSDPLGPTNWFQGIPARFPAHSGASNSYISADQANALGPFPVVSNWLITPVLRFAPGNSISFFTRSLGGAGSSQDRLVVRLCQEAPGANCKDPGDESGSTGDYGFDPLLWINENSVAGGYPTTWTQFNATSAHGLPTSGTGRIAFHYYTFADDGWGSTIGIDSLSLLSTAVCGFSDTLFTNGFEGP